MKLNPDCVRDVMIALEEKTGIEFDERNGFFSFKAVRIHPLYMETPSLCKRYSREEVAYTLLQLSESGYVVADWKRDERFLGVKFGFILYLTPKGHDFVSALHDKETWTAKLKPILDRFGSVSLSVIEAVSKGAMDAALDRFVPTLFTDKS